MAGRKHIVCLCAARGPRSGGARNSRIAAQPPQSPALNQCSLCQPTPSLANEILPTQWRFLMGKKTRTTEMIEIIGLNSELDDDRTWRVAWPEPDGSKGHSDYQSCELAVGFALLIRLTMSI